MIFFSRLLQILLLLFLLYAVFEEWQAMDEE